MAKTQTWSFPGGLHPPQHKSLSNQDEIRDAALPKRVVLPIHQHIGAAAKPVVEVGDHVLRGQVVAQAEGYVSAPVHASISGHVVAIGEFAIPHPSGLSGECIVIESDGEDSAVEPNSDNADYQNIDPSHLRNVVREAGIVGLGGAAFPSAVKLNPGPTTPVDTLILNGAECEPYITCDDRAMRERADDLVAGIGVLMHILGTSRCLVGIEDNKPEAQAAVSAAIIRAGRGDTEVVSTPTIYPEGGEKQLIKVLTGKEVDKNSLPSSVGVVCQNIGTTLAIYRAVMFGEALTERVITVTGRGVGSAGNFNVRIGTPIEDLVSNVGGYTDSAERLIMGGPMMGFALTSDEIPVVKSTNCILVAKADEVKPNVEDAMPCIRCGECAEVCPVSLLPQQMYWYAKGKDFDKAQEYNLFDCIECGCCAHVCPSHIPLVQFYRYAKSEIWDIEREKKKADHARVRHESRQARIDREAAEKAAKAAEKRKAVNSGEDAKQAAIKAALARAAAKKAAQAGKPEQAAPANNAEDAIAKAKAKAAAASAAVETKSAAQLAIEKAKAKAATKPQDGDTKSAAQLAIEKAKAKAAASAQDGDTKSAAQLAIEKAKAKATASDQDGDTKSAAQLAIEKAKAKAAASTQDGDTKSDAQLAIEKAKAKAAALAHDGDTKSAAQLAIEKAKAKAAATAQDSDTKSAAQLAIEKAKAKAAASTQGGDTKSAAQLAIEKAQAKAAAKQPSNGGE